MKENVNLSEHVYSAYFYWLDNLIQNENTSHLLFTLHIKAVRKPVAIWGQVQMLILLLLRRVILR